MATSTGLIGDHGGTSAAMSGHEIRFDGRNPAFTS